MIHIKYKKEDKRYLFLYGDKKELKKLEDHLNKIPSYMFLPSFSGVPKPEVFLNHLKMKDGRDLYWCFSGLWREVQEFCKKEGIECDEMDGEFKYREEFNLTEEEFKEKVRSWNLNIEPRDYQYHCAWLILKYRQSLSQLATRAGKTLIAYLIFRYLLEEEHLHNILMVVPNTSLVRQGVEDMKQYKEFFKTEEVWAKGEMCSSSNLTIGTFQSLVKKAMQPKWGKKNDKYDPQWFNKFDVVLVDECHTAKCESIKSILSLDFLKNVKIKFGFTGSLPLKNTIDSFQCQALLGPCIQDLRSKELIDQQFLAVPHITQLRLNYLPSDKLLHNYIVCGEYLCSNVELDKEGKPIHRDLEDKDFTMKDKKKLPFALQRTKQLLSDEEYMSYLVDLCKSKGSNLLMLEQMLLHRTPSRVDLISRLLAPLKKNAIVFFHHTEYGRYLKEELEKRFSGRKVYLITGGTTVKKREEVMKELNETGEEGKILCASYGCCSTGLTFKNMDYGVFAQSFKSQIINKQSIGRLMYKTGDKKDFYLYDLVDCFPTEMLKRQGYEKVKIYKKEEIDYKVKELNIEY